MFEKIGRLAEAAASSVGESRRGFLGRLGQGALAAAALLGGVFVSPAAAQSGGVVCCKYDCGPRAGHHLVCQAAGTTCAPQIFYGYGPCPLKSQLTRPTCARC